MEDKNQSEETKALEKKQYNSGIVNLLAAVGIIAVIVTVCDPGSGDKSKSEPVFKDDKTVIDGIEYKKGQLYRLGNPKNDNVYFVAFSPDILKEFDMQDEIGRREMIDVSVGIIQGPHKATLIGGLGTISRVRALEGDLKGKQFYVFGRDLEYIDK
jgi:hypothetical protein